jgi:D-alanyl-D-alanine carboxypeptidase
MYAEFGSEVALSDLIQGVIIQSANDGAIAIAEGLAGSEERYAADMTARARELGLTVSTFKNATGLPAEGHVSSVREFARLTRYLIEVFPGLLQVLWPTRIYLEQDPAAQPQSVAGRLSGCRWRQDRLHTRSRLWIDRFS